MTIDWWTLVFQTINFVVLVWLLARYLFRPVAKIVAERQAAAQSAIEDAKAARAEAEAERNSAEEQKSEIAARRSSLIDAAKKDAAEEREKLLEAARADAEKARAEGVAELEKLHDKEARALADEAGTLATDIAARLLDRLPEEARIAGFIDGLSEAVAKLPEATRKSIGADGPVTIKAARELTDEETAALSDRLGQALGRSIDLRIVTDADLIAGLELTAPHAIVRNHLRADLKRIQAELASHG